MTKALSTHCAYIFYTDFLEASGSFMLLVHSPATTRLFPRWLPSLQSPVPFLGGAVFTPASFVPGMVRVGVGGSSDTFAEVVHGERKQEVRLHLARLESGLLWGEGQVRLHPGEVAHRCVPCRCHLDF